jgi:hypothetical protein
MRRQLQAQGQSLEDKRALCAEQGRQLQFLEEELLRRDEALKVLREGQTTR